MRKHGTHRTTAALIDRMLELSGRPGFEQLPAAEQDRQLDQLLEPPQKSPPPSAV